MRQRLAEEAIARLVNDVSRGDLGDPRRTARAQQVLRRLAASPGASLPDAMTTDAELEGAYRLFSNAHVSFEQLLGTHVRGTIERAETCKTVLALHDTTECAFGHADPDEIGYLSTGQAGFSLHLTLLVDTHEWQRPLGLSHGEIRRRATKPRRGGRKKSSGFQTQSNPDRESLRWFRSIAATESHLAATGTQVIHVADRESDSYELMSTCLTNGHRFLFRARTNRRVLDDGEKLLMRDFVEGAPVRMEREVPLSRRLEKGKPPRRKNVHPPRESRVAHLEFAVANATLYRPHFLPAKRAPKTIEVNVLHVYEVDPPAGQDPVDWLLYTSESLDTARQVAKVVDYYRCRWQIEELNKALKTGCVVQKRQLESFDAITTMLALSLPVAVELLALRALARNDIDRPADVLLTKPQLDALRHISHRELPLKPTAQDALWCIAGLGGHIKNNGPAGWQVLQRGMEKFMAFSAGWCAAKAS
jgi:Transposase DNA-binding/Transposase DDE domain